MAVKIENENDYENEHDWGEVRPWLNSSPRRDSAVRTFQRLEKPTSFAFVFLLRKCSLRYSGGRKLARRLPQSAAKSGIDPIMTSEMVVPANHFAVSPTA
jgi:hypothetical protein